MLAWLLRARPRLTALTALSLGGLILGTLSGCSSPPAQTPTAPAAPASAASSPATSPAPEPARVTLLRERSRWVAADWAELPGWGDAALRPAWSALLRGCERPAQGWAQLCQQARALEAQDPPDEATLRFWLIKQLQPYRVEDFQGQSSGLLTGYYEPELPAQRRAQGNFRVPLLSPDPQLRRLTRQQIDTQSPERLARAALAWLEDPLDALVVQIQGSGRLQLTEPDGSTRWVRVAFAGHNDQPYQSIGRWLIQQGELQASEASWPGIKDWVRRNPKQQRELLWRNPRYVFFREEPLPDLKLGPRGAQGVPLTPGHSVAVDRLSVPYGTPLWLDSTEPLSSTPLRRLVMAQDTGSAIVGAVRADFFWGWGREAEAQAGRMKQSLRLWALWPRQDTP
ncbi:murein transglycosylase A [Roseateles sp. BYS180W]|uniref:peptidoglycan lytic exotransglycosylase n=1 Tax=Roseateles rivi TaxID=3299028 RepID=A0ABW7FWQ1_9BURK